MSAMWPRRPPGRVRESVPRRRSTALAGPSRMLARRLPRWSARASPSGSSRPSMGLIRSGSGRGVAGLPEATVRLPRADCSAFRMRRRRWGDAFEVVLGSGTVVRVPPSFDSAALVRLLEALAQARAC